VPSSVEPAAARLSVADKEKLFYTFTKFAVVGASENTAKMGCVIFQAYKEAFSDVYPINPSLTTVNGVPCLRSVADIPPPKSTAIIIVTHPTSTLTVLEDAKRAGTPMIWIQRGAQDAAVLAFLEEHDMKDITLCTTSASKSGSSTLKISIPDKPVSGGTIMVTTSGGCPDIAFAKAVAAAHEQARAGGQVQEAAPDGSNAAVVGADLAKPHEDSVSSTATEENVSKSASAASSPCALLELEKREKDVIAASASTSSPLALVELEKREIKVVSVSAGTYFDA